MRISEAARALGTTPRILRYRESVGLLPAAALAPGRHRQYEPEDLAAADWAATVEQRYAVSPQALAFALRVMSETRVAADVFRLGELTGRLTPSTRALDFDQLKAQRLLAGRR
jgi:MerR family transcriptional regulator, copper efflux regulator